MTMEEAIRSRILQNFKSVRAFALRLGVPYSTVDTMLKKGVRYSSLELVGRVCAGLGLDLGELEQGRLSSSTAPLRLISDTEQRHIEQYRALDRHGKRAVDTLLALEYERVNEEIGYAEELAVAARSKDAAEKKLTVRRNFSNEELRGEESEF